MNGTSQLAENISHVLYEQNLNYLKWFLAKYPMTNLLLTTRTGYLPSSYLFKCLLRSRDDNIYEILVYLYELHGSGEILKSSKFDLCTVSRYFPKSVDYINNLK